MKIYQIIILFFSIIYSNTIAQNAIQLNNNDVISYCYQPLIQSLGLKQIYTINADGTNNRAVTNSQIGLCHQDWSFDTLKFTAVGYVDAGNTTWSIFTFHSNGTNLTRLTNTSNVWIPNLYGHPI
jgi:hypothetical protein